MYNYIYEREREREKEREIYISIYDKESVIYVKNTVRRKSIVASLMISYTVLSYKVDRGCAVKYSPTRFNYFSTLVKFSQRTSRE